MELLYEFIICLCGYGILYIYNIVIHVNLEFFFQNCILMLKFFLHVLGVVRVCLV